MERAILTLLLEGHASYRGIQGCLRELLGLQVSVGTIAAVVQEAGERARQWMSQHRPATARGLALDEMYGSQRGEAYRSRVDVGSGAVWASTSPVGVDGDRWTLLLWQLQEEGLHWHTTGSSGGRAIGEAVSRVSPQRPHQRDVWHVLYACRTGARSAGPCRGAAQSAKRGGGPPSGSPGSRQAGARPPSQE